MDKSKYNYYDVGGLSHDDIAKAKLTPDEYVGALKYLLYKYLNRMPYKGQEQQDAEKIKIIAEELPIAVKAKLKGGTDAVVDDSPLKWIESNIKVQAISKFMDGTSTWHSVPGVFEAHYKDADIKTIRRNNEGMGFAFNIYLTHMVDPVYAKEFEPLYYVKGK